MKIRLTSIALVTVFCTACFPTRIVTISEPVSSTPSYSTVVTMPKTHLTTTTTQVYATEPDISLYLDLQAVAAIFAQSSTVREFESLLNNSSYIISNLDLNRDGYVDYLRVVSAMQGYNHVFVIQAALGPNVFQDVATVVAEVPAYGNYYVEVIGSSYIYGPNYVIRPVYYTRPYIFNHICRHDYSPWKSPWYWNHYPSYYKYPAPVHVNHYHAYVNTFMKNHKYCHEVLYYNTCHYQNYQRLCTTICRNDYGKQYPERSFTVRNANLPVNNSAVQRAENATRTQANAYDVRMAYDATKTTTTSATRGSSSGSSTSATRGTSTSTGTSATRGTTETSGSASTTRGSASTSGSSATRGSSTTSSSSATRGSSTGSSSSATRGTSSTTTSGSSTRGTAGTSNTGSSTSGSSATRSSSSTTSSRVQSSGSSSTRTSTTTATGQQSTVRRGSSSATATRSTTSSSATRSTGSTSATRSSGTSSSTRSSGTSTSSSGTSSTRSTTTRR
ncbi:MAG: hypothetical protein ACI3Z0_02710 [Candidatus Cryptobacteroides sp.]